MESQNLAAMVAKRDEFREAIRLLEARPQSRGKLAVGHLIERLRIKAEWLDKRIEMEMKTPPTSRAA